MQWLSAIDQTITLHVDSWQKLHVWLAHVGQSTIYIWVFTGKVLSTPWYGYILRTFLFYVIFGLFPGNFQILDWKFTRGRFLEKPWYWISLFYFFTSSRVYQYCGYLKTFPVIVWLVYIIIYSFVAKCFKFHHKRY